MKRSNAISESFKERADSSAFYEAWVGAMLSRAGLYTLHHPFTLMAETGNPASFYANTWDIDVRIPGSEVFVPVEVKSVNLRFTLPNDYPHLGCLVCSYSSFSKKWPGELTTKRDFLMVSRSTGAIIWLPWGTPIGLQQVTDKSRGESYECVSADKSYLMPFESFVTAIKNK